MNTFSAKMNTFNVKINTFSVKINTFSVKMTTFSVKIKIFSVTRNYIRNTHSIQFGVYYPVIQRIQLQRLFANV